MLSKIMSQVFHAPPLVYVTVALSTILYMKTRRRIPPNIPPLPSRPLPILGNILLLKNGLDKVFNELKKTTGNIFSLYIGSDLLVVINDYSILKEAFVKHADILSDRPTTFVADHVLHGKNEGLLSSSGPNWKEQRTASLSILRSFGMGKNLLVEKINEEVECYVQTLSDLKGEPTDVQILTNASVSNVIVAILIGNRFEYDDPYFVKFIKLLNEYVILLGRLQILNTFPWLRFLPGDRFGARKILEIAGEMKEHIGMRYINENRDNEDPTANFISAYLHEMKKKENSGTETYLDEGNLKIVIVNLFLAGTETTSSSLMWAMLFAMHFPDKQKKVYDEIVDVIGTDRSPVIQDKTHMHYTHAYILETLRYGCIVPTSLLHLCSDDVDIAGYNIPKGTTVVANLKGILHDEKVWGDPDIFRPERFLDADNVVSSPEEFIPFGIGRRYCMGESLARMELFLFLTRIFQRFEIQPEDPNNLPTLEARFGAASAPHNYKVRLIERN